MEKIRIQEKETDRPYYYTGEVEELDHDWVKIKTIKGETLRFRREQIRQRQEI